MKKTTAKTKKRVIGVVTGARSDFGIYLPLLQAIRSSNRFSLRLYATGMHLSRTHGMTVRQIEDSGFSVDARIPCLSRDDTPLGMANAMAKATAGFAGLFGRERPDILIVLGDRFEMHAATVAAVPFRIPLAHIHGGELTYGALDDSFRHSMTKLSHLHFVSTADYGRRVRQMGEESWRVTVCGALSLDQVKTIPLFSKTELESKFGLSLDVPPILVTYHPVTQEYDRMERNVRDFMAALRERSEPVVFTMPNADPGGMKVRAAIHPFLKARPDARAVESMGTRGYFSLMSMAKVMVGNSSSGILEAASFRLPVVNVGSRQEGRMRGKNVIDVGDTVVEIRDGIRKVASASFRRSIEKVKNPYDQGGAALKIVDVLARVKLDRALLCKRFTDAKTQAQSQRT